ncbi:zinc-binding dehydrogenase [Enteractinococcus helveticum]|uniref:Zn-dependent oxidoreductase n=1 Tax=Enteractinococcus helveticum TaxID=1837282 RepID=A0A1B7LZK0_9MICC|nr:zinc-binding dehydrogenase [Enteractinococcus helveticum]OAV60923.1 Zn-dependent oxidoreductase [Enteractinococcus helveticum]
MRIPTTMRAAVIHDHGGYEVLEVKDVDVPSVQPGEVLIEVRSAALNNTDLWTRQGAYGSPENPNALSGWRGPITFPRIQGADVAGRVVAVGSAQDEQLIGARVVIDPAIYDTASPDANPVGLMGSERDGGYAQYVTAPTARVHDMTDAPLTDDQLATLPTAYGTALGMMERGRVQAGQTVLVSGASGGVGLGLVQLARARGARVLAISSGSKRKAVQQAGAHEVLDRAYSIVEQVHAVAPQGIDIGLDVVAGDLLRDGLPLLKESGRWVVSGALGGYDVRFDVRRLYLHNAQLIGSSMHTPTHFDLLMQLARSGAVDPVIAAAYSLDDVHQAQQTLERRTHVGKIVLHPWP